LKINILECKLTNNRIRCYGHASAMNEGRENPKAAFECEAKGNCPRDKYGNNRLGKMSHRRKTMGRN
jgi:hypothetical protein